MTIRFHHALVVAVTGLVGCMKLGPQVSDDPDLGVNIKPDGTLIPGIADNPDLIAQIRINDGLVDAALAANGNTVIRSSGKAAGAPVFYWDFGAAQVEGAFAVVAPMFVFVNQAGQPLPHPPLLDTIPGDLRYSAIRRVVNVMVTDKYNNELIPSKEALDDAIALGLVNEPVGDGTWLDAPVVLPNVKLEVATGQTVGTHPAFARGFQVDYFELGTSLGSRQGFRGNLVPVGQGAFLLSGVPTGTPPTLPATVDPKPVFQFAIPAAAPNGMFNYTPLVTEVDVRLASGVAPTDIMADGDLFKRGVTGAISAYFSDKVLTFTVTTTVTHKTIQFKEGSP